MALSLIVKRGTHNSLSSERNRQGQLKLETMSAKKTKEEIAISILPAIAAAAYNECTDINEDAQAISGYAWAIASEFVKMRAENK